MSIDHTRPLPVPQERLDFIADTIFDLPFNEMTRTEQIEVYRLALEAEQVEHLANISFYLSEAHEIYNQRFR